MSAAGATPKTIAPRKTVGASKTADNIGKDKGDASLGIKWAEPEELLPLYVPPAGTASMLLQLRDDSSAASLSYEFSIVGGDPQKKSKEFQVRLRNKGPLYLK
jgi:hypothetical protein